MKVELKNIKTAAFVVDEPGYYQAVVYLDGVKSLEASNGGDGGGDRFRDLVPGAYDRLAAYCATLPPYKSPYGMRDLPMSPDMLMATLVDMDSVRKKLSRSLKKATMYTRTDALGVWKVKLPYTAESDKRLRKTVKVACILNTLPMEEAVALYMKATEAAESAKTVVDA